MIILLAVTTEPILRYSKNENILIPLDSAALHNDDVACCSKYSLNASAS